MSDRVRGNVECLDCRTDLEKPLPLGRLQWLCEDCRPERLEAYGRARAALERDPRATADGPSHRFDRLAAAVAEAGHRLDELRESCDASAKTVGRLRRELNALGKRFNSLEQFCRTTNLEVHGLSEDCDLDAALEGLGAALDEKVTADVVTEAYWLPSRAPGDKGPVLLVKFLTRTSRNRWLEKGRKLQITSGVVLGNKDNRKVYINENLTLFIKGLLRETKHRAKEKGYRFVWVKQGKICVRKEPGEPTVCIRTEQDLDKLC